MDSANIEDRTVSRRGPSLSSYRTDPWLFWCVVFLSAWVVVPFWVSEFLPFLDIPQHLATIGVMHHFGDAEFDFARAFKLETGSTQYLLYYVTCDLLAGGLGVESANRVFLSLYAILLPLSVIHCLGAWGRIRFAGLLAYPLVFNQPLFLGFVNYVFALPFLFFGLGLLRRVILGRGRGESQWRREILLGMCALVVFYSHLQVFLVYLGGLGLVVLMHWSGVKSSLLRLIHLVPAVGLFGAWLLSTNGLAGGEGWESAVSKRFSTLVGAKWETPFEQLMGFSQRVLGVYRDSADEYVTIGLGFGILSLLLLRRGGRAIRELAPEVLTVFVLGFYFAMPTNYDWVWPVNWRFAPMFVMLLLLWGRGAVPGPVRVLGTLAFAALATFSIWVHVERFRAFDIEARQAKAVLAEIAPRARVYALIHDTQSAIVDGPVYAHFVQYHQLRKGGVSAFSFAEAPQSPIRFKSVNEGGPPPTALYSEWKPERFRFAELGAHYDYFLVRGGPGSVRQGQFPKRVKKVAERGMWSLYHNPR